MVSHRVADPHQIKLTISPEEHSAVTARPPTVEQANAGTQPWRRSRIGFERRNRRENKVVPQFTITNHHKTLPDCRLRGRKCSAAVLALGG